MELIDRLRHVERMILFSDRDIPENDVEHSYQLAIAAWHIVRVDDLSLDIDRVIKYALVHDLIEAYAGDEPFYGRDATKDADKRIREEKAMRRIATELADFQELIDTMTQYASQADSESQFVYALDKLLPVIQNYMHGGLAWQKNGITLDELIDKKSEKISEPHIRIYFDQIIEILQKDRKSLFGEVPEENA